MAQQGQPPQHQVPPQQPLAPPFCLALAYNNRASLNYNERRDAQVYYKGCEAHPYNGKGLPEFLASIATKARQSEWMEILTIDGRNFLMNYADITATQVRQAAMDYQPQNDR
jgi:hypothetical protein